MGSSSRSSQTQHTSNQNTQVSWADNSEHFTDNSDNSSFDFNQDNSDNSIVEISNEGWGAGSNIGGNVTIVDGGAISAMRDVSTEAIKGATEQTYLATQVAENTAREAMDFGRDAVASNERVSRDAMITAENTAKSSIAGMRDTASEAMQGLLEGSEAAIAGVTKSSTENTDKAIAATTAAMERNAALIQTTALGGQDLMIDMVKKVLIGVAVALTVGGVTYAISGRRARA
ncbi:hypothetical protein [Bowmanella yangjiangensis]|uniref:Methyl-accepting chemotaxis protein n=1 Tax=Bowmanella yangjiangensis TaxID=2811230 RepID=A0ABS3CTT4_9ALTE|nr:hypothetical protein [Bowmanella yangjiangensis]MBN7820527.1 hypothetical protein [Bowmanella yangjiangensis]